MRKLCSVFVLFAVALGQDAVPPKKEAPQKPALTTKWLAPMQWRSIGPANMGGRITALAVYEKDPSRWWAATASGGLLKTVNNGVTFEHQFDREKTVSVGDIAVSQSNPEIVWVGSGECNPRNSVSWGNGVYKSADGGKTWKNMGLEKSFQIGAVCIHPSNPDIVYVGALGRLWGAGGDRGLYKTTNGGKSWKRIHFVDDKTGVIDVRMHPSKPDTLLVATWERQRDGFDGNDPAKKWGPGSGLYKTTDGGATFQKITAGLPAGKLGRMGLDYSSKNPDVVYMVLESENLGKEPEDAPYIGIYGGDSDAGARLTRIVKDGPAAKAGLKQNDIVLSIDDKTVHSYNDFIRIVRQYVAGDKVRVEVSRERKSVIVELTFGSRPKPKPKPAPKPKAKEGKAAEPAPKPAPSPAQPRRSPFAAGLGGQRANFQDQQGKQGHEYGGIFRSADGGETWTRVNSVNPRPMYFSEIRVDPSDDNHVWVLGIRLWKSKDGGKTMTPDGHGRGVHVDHHAMWIDPSDGRHVILGNDGGIYVTYDRGKNWDHHNHMAIGQFYHAGVGPRRAYKVYGGLQDNGSWGGPSRVRHAAGPTNADWIRVGGGDGFVCRVDRHDPDQIYFEAQNGAIGRRHLKTAERTGFRPRPPKGSKYRFNWNTPFVLSHHNSKIYYTAGNHVFRSLDRGNGLRAISPEITVGDRGSATALAESSLDPNLLWVGTDDGALWLTRDGGHTWTDLFKDEQKKELEPAPAPAPGPSPAEKNGNGNGKENGAENAPEPVPDDRAKRMIERLLQMDANGDGALQKDEVPERAQGLFDRLDTNKDGIIDGDEIKAGATLRAARGGRRRGRDAAAGAEPKKQTAQASPKKTLAQLLPDRRWVNHIEASRFVAGRAYVVFDGHRSNDDRPLLFATEDHGKSWRSLRGDLPDDAGTTRVLCEDLKNPDLLYLGTEFGAWASIDRGEHWVSLKTNLPTVAVHAFAPHEAAHEIVAATHGRSLWVLDVTTLRQLKPELLLADAHLFAPNAAVTWRPLPGRGASRTFTGTNPSSGAEIYYTLAGKANSITLRVTDLEGKTVRELKPTASAGLNHVSWDLRKPRPAGRRGRFFRVGPRVEPGVYRIVLTVGDKTLTQDLKVEIDPEHTDERWIAYENHAEELEAERLASKSKRRYPWKHEQGNVD